MITRDEIKPDSGKVQGIMDLERPTTTTKVRTPVGIEQYYRDMWLKVLHVLATLLEASSGFKGRIFWNNEIEVAFR